MVGVPKKETLTIKSVKYEVFMCMRMSKMHFSSGVIEYMYQVRGDLPSIKCFLLVCCVLSLWRSC